MFAYGICFRSIGHLFLIPLKPLNEDPSLKTLHYIFMVVRSSHPKTSSLSNSCRNINNSSVWNTISNAELRNRKNQVAQKVDWASGARNRASHETLPHAYRSHWHTQWLFSNFFRFFLNHWDQWAPAPPTLTEGRRSARAITSGSVECFQDSSESENWRSNHCLEASVRCQDMCWDFF